MKINPRLGTGIVGGIYIISFLGITKFLNIDFDDIEYILYISAFIIGLGSHILFENLNKK